MVAKAKPVPVPVPVQTELSVSYSVGVKAQIIKYELTGDVHVSRSEKFNVEGLDADEIDAFYDKRYASLKEDMDGRISREYNELMGRTPEGEES